MTQFNTPNLFFLVATIEPSSNQIVAAYLVGQVSRTTPHQENKVYNAVQAALHAHSTRDGFQRKIMSWGSRDFCERHAKELGLTIDRG